MITLGFQIRETLIKWTFVWDSKSLLADSSHCQIGSRDIGQRHPIQKVAEVRLVTAGAVHQTALAHQAVALFVQQLQVHAVA